MPPTRQDRTPECTEGITVELTEFGLWIEVHDQAEGWQGVFLSARAVRRLVALPPQARLAALAALDPAALAARHRHKYRRGQVPTEDTDGEPGAA
jgi:hypothetical protein